MRTCGFEGALRIGAAQQDFALECGVVQSKDLQERASRTLDLLRMRSISPMRGNVYDILKIKAEFLDDCMQIMC